MANFWTKLGAVGLVGGGLVAAKGGAHLAHDAGAIFSGTGKVLSQDAGVLSGEGSLFRGARELPDTAPSIPRPHFGTDLGDPQDPTNSVPRIGDRWIATPKVLAPPDLRVRVNGELQKIGGQCGGGAAGSISVEQVYTFTCLTALERIRVNCVASRSSGNLASCRDAADSASCPAIGTSTLLSLGAACAGVRASLL
jgi:hypothetical protein